MALKYKNGEGTYEQIAKEYGIKLSSLQDIVSKYEAVGKDGLKDTSKYMNYSDDLKTRTVEDYLSGGTSLLEISRKYKIRSKTALGECTGLRGKNGKLIFEGNIVKTIWQHFGSTDTVIGIVKYDNADFILETDDHYLFFEDNIFSADCNVISNIHNNPELLKGEQKQDVSGCYCSDCGGFHLCEHKFCHWCGAKMDGKDDE